MGVEEAIRAARAVAASDGAAELRKQSAHAGAWNAEDEARLREGWIRIWDPNRKRWDRLDVPVRRTGP